MKNPFSGNGGWAVLYRLTVILAIAAALLAVML